MLSAFWADPSILRSDVIDASPAMPQVRESLGQTGEDQPSALGHLARFAAGRLAQAGIAVEPLLRKAQLPVALLEGPKLKVGARSQMVFLQHAAEALGDDLLGFHLALDFDFKQLGLFAYLIASCDTVTDALDRAARFSWTLNEGVRLTLRRDNALTLRVEFVGLERHRDKQQMEFWLTCQLRALRELTRLEIVPASVGFMHRRGAEPAEMHRFFGREVAFGASDDRMSFGSETALLPLVTADRHLQSALLQYFEDVSGHPPHHRESLRTAVENAAVARLPHGMARLDTVAHDLGMSPRTLSRRLAEEGLSFTTILEELRADLSMRYLQDKTLSIGQIGWFLGYTEASTFVRAVRRWTGKSPSQLRRGC